MFPINVTVVTGFLGSGKTTLINRLLSDPALRDTAVIVNEFGEISIDHLLVESSSDDVIEIAGGCLCCTVRGELADTLASLVDRVQTGRLRSLDRIVIETTGLADPVPVLHAIQSHPALAQALRVDRVITTIDAAAGGRTLDAHREARRQLAAADIVVMTKTDLVQNDEAAKLHAMVTAMSSARFIDSHEILENPSSLLQIGTLPERNTGPAQHDHSGHHHHEPDVTSHVLVHQTPIAWAAVSGFLDLLLSRTDLDVLRVKGLVLTKENPDRPVEVHAVQTFLHAPRQLESWPERAERQTTLVIIGSKIDGGEIGRLFKAFAGLPQTDMPDRVALENNPLAIPGMG